MDSALVVAIELEILLHVDVDVAGANVAIVVS